MASLRDFIPLEKLGEGSFSTVYKVKRVSDGKLYALKKVQTS
jgi:NIMA (never in mitosis gene a)-related kinase